MGREKSLQTRLYSKERDEKEREQMWRRKKKKIKSTVCNQYSFALTCLIVFDLVQELSVCRGESLKVKL